MLELMNEMNAQMAAEVSQTVQLWMNWMLAIFMASIFFVKNHKGARVAFISIILSMPIALGVYAHFRNVHILGIAHFMAWLPVLIYFVKVECKSIQFKSPYGVWAALLNLTIIVSLLFDTRDIFLVLTGAK